MAKFYGKIGFATTKETRPGIWEETIEERPYYGYTTRYTRSLSLSSSVNPDINISNTIDIVADPYTSGHIFDMRYVIFRGGKWKISSVEVKDKHLLLTVGGLWNETSD